MPPSTDTHVRRPSISLRAPTVYSATPARATSDRPGSTNRCGSAQPVLGAAPLERRHDLLGVRLDRRRGLLAHVLGREAAAGAVLAEMQAVLAHHVGSEREHDAVRLVVRRQVEQRRAEVAVQPDEIDAARAAQRLRDGGLGGAGADRKAELGVERAGRRLGVRVRIDAGRQAQDDRLLAAQRARQPVEQLQLVEVVDDDAADAGVERLAQLLLALVVAVEVAARRREARRQRHRQLAAATRCPARCRRRARPRP